MTSLLVLHIVLVVGSPTHSFRSVGILCGFMGVRSDLKCIYIVSIYVLMCVHGFVLKWCVITVWTFSLTLFSIAVQIKYKFAKTSLQSWDSWEHEIKVLKKSGTGLIGLD